MAFAALRVFPEKALYHAKKKPGAALVVQPFEGLGQQRLVREGVLRPGLKAGVQHRLHLRLRHLVGLAVFIVVELLGPEQGSAQTGQKKQPQKGQEAHIHHLFQQFQSKASPLSAFRIIIH